MKKIIISVALSVMAMSGYAASSPAETAGLCAANAYVIKKAADAAGIPKLANMAQAQLVRNYQNYGQQPGFKQASEWQLKQNLTSDQRLKIADGCTKEGF